MTDWLDELDRLEKDYVANGYRGSHGLEIQEIMAEHARELIDAVQERNHLRFLLRDVVSHQPDCVTDSHHGCADWCPIRKAWEYLDAISSSQEGSE